eukprot:scaffold60132_cov27-Tisochrysis_lutea.AAC.2
MRQIDQPTAHILKAIVTWTATPTRLGRLNPEKHRWQQIDKGLLCLAQTNKDREKSVKFGFEAAVCGGIPVIHSLQRDFLADEVTQLSGIINGCTNFILSNMAQGGLSYSDALKEASALG